jgi:hypothetical protein
MKETQAFLENPFKVEGITTIQYVAKVDEKVVIDTNTGEAFTMKKIPKNSMHDHDGVPYVKVFQEKTSLLLQLPTPSLKLFIYALGVARPITEIVFLNIDDCMMSCGFKSATSYREGIKGLIEANIIARRVGSKMEYWVNPNVFFNGNRLRLKY